MTEAGRTILTALDVPTLGAAKVLVAKLKGKTGLKAGLQLITAAGLPAVVEAVGRNFFADLKFYDIPNTVAGAVRAAALQGVSMVNVHCSGGEKMMAAAVEARNKVSEETGTYTAIIGVTMLTSHTRESLDSIGINPRATMEEVVKQLTRLAINADLDGVVCSPLEISTVRAVADERPFTIITPGIRAKDAKPDDQARTMTAGEAIHLGADYVVIGRPITAEPDPAAAADRFIAEIEGALLARA